MNKIVIVNGKKYEWKMERMNGREYEILVPFEYTVEIDPKAIWEAIKAASEGEKK